jgi:hypothetical protein
MWHNPDAPYHFAGVSKIIGRHKRSGDFFLPFQDRLGDIL